MEANSANITLMQEEEELVLDSSGATKVLANRIKVMMLDIVSANLATFVPGKAITDIVRGFAEDWFYLIMLCIFSVSHSIILNSKEVDPVTPRAEGNEIPFLHTYLFCVVKGCQLFKRRLSRGGIHECNTVKFLLKQFEEASGQSIYFHSSVRTLKWPLACKGVLQKISSLNLQQVIIKMDAKIVFDGILSTAHDDLEFGVVLEDCRSMFCRASDFSIIVHAHRLANRE
ncbi:hypothetical protein SADUNF_Sadunf03G0011600 [Salix dunnii]|uniref:RNase H type-1 domain-containing protein n=1 Tax=Salix dunnii TaxID=1413687 RepID=A0A835MZY4_9ROSI|nr:hypothetical protein SADUNF_Sadunf03G0011600 [Salix dunnii]